jgi:transcriptional regulator with XRE-family HTH domain
MRRKGLSHRKFAEAAGVSTQSVTNWLAGGQMKPDRFPRVAYVLDMSVDEFIGRRPAREPSETVATAQADEALEVARSMARLAHDIEPLGRVIPDLIRVLRDAQEVAARH